MPTEKDLNRLISIKATNQETLQDLAEKITIALTQVIKEQCPEISDEKCEKAVRDSVLEIFEQFGEATL